MFPDDRYPFSDEHRPLPHDAIKVADRRDVEIWQRHISFFLVRDGEPVGRLILVEERRTGYFGIWDLNIRPDLRRNGYGRMLYEYILKDLHKTIRAASNQTPCSRALWVSLWRDPDLKVYAVNPSTRKKHDVYPDNGQLKTDADELYDSNLALEAAPR